MPTPPMPGWKLPLAVGSRSPMFSDAFTLSRQRSSGACSTVVLASLMAACSSALGSVVEKSALERCPKLESGIAAPVTLLAVPVAAVVPVVVVDVVLDVLDVVDVVLLVVLPCTWIDERGVKFTGTFKPVDAMAAVICLLKVELASMTRMSSNTSGRGLSRSCAIFSASATRSASPFSTMAYCAVSGKTLVNSGTVRTALTTS